jgi:ribonuclease HII
LKNHLQVLLSNLEPGRIEAGCDEAGRGCIAGPVVAAAVILPETFHHPLLNDSKKLTERQRNTLRPIIIEQAVSWAVEFIDHEKIDEINILNASFLAMHLATDKLEVRPDILLIDGNRFNPHEIPHQCIIKGDSKIKCIAAASVLAKTFRDDYMLQLDAEFPHYSWRKNKGYPTKQHRASIQLHGPSSYHRKSFQLLPRDLD